MATLSQVDSQGNYRGRCAACTCKQYESKDGRKCDYCGCHPVCHEKVSSGVLPVSTCALPGCHQPVYVDITSGKFYLYCSKVHARSMKTCALPGCNKSVFVEKRRIHNYCTKAHAEDSKKPKCLLPHCNHRVYVDSSGKQMDFCSISHANQGIAQNIIPRPQTSQVKLIDSSNPKFNEVKTQFLSKFLNRAPPQVLSILKIIASDNLATRYNKYRDNIIANRPDLATGGKHNGGPGNEQRRFHGTSKQACNLGMNQNETLCNISGCNTCGIIRNGLLISKAGGNFNTLEFGQGIYLSSASSKSHSYNAGTSNGLGSGIRSMFICKVIVGKGKKMTLWDPFLTAAPPGYDAVLAEGGTRVYDEVVVYDESAVLPAYIVVYKD